MQISDRVHAIEPSLARKLFNLAKEYDDVIDLTLGDPDIMPPMPIRDAGCAAIQKGLTRYSHNAGLLVLRKAIAASIRTRYPYATSCCSDNIIATVGGMEALFLSMASILNPGDEVIIFGPYYVNYVQMANALGAKPIIINTEIRRQFTPSVDMIEKYVNPKTKLIILNSPANPTGIIIPEKNLVEFMDFACRNNLYLISDEVYKDLVWEGNHNSLLQYEMRDNFIVIDSTSKRFAMTGWRLGYAVASAPVIDAMIKLQENVAACASLPSQYAAIEAYSKRIDTTYIATEFKARRDLVWSILQKSTLLRCLKPCATFYFFVDISKSGMHAIDFAINLLREKHVAVVPGENFGKDFFNYIRIACTVDQEKLRSGIEALVDFSDNINHK